MMFSQKPWDMDDEGRKLHDSDCKYLSSGHSNVVMSIQTGGQWVEAGLRERFESQYQEFSMFLSLEHVSLGSH